MDEQCVVKRIKPEDLVGLEDSKDKTQGWEVEMLSFSVVPGSCGAGNHPECLGVFLTGVPFSPPGISLEHAWSKCSKPLWPECAGSRLEEKVLPAIPWELAWADQLLFCFCLYFCYVISQDRTIVCGGNLQSFGNLANKCMLSKLQPTSFLSSEHSGTNLAWF